MSIETRLDRLEEARGDERPTMVIYEADVELSREEEAAFLKVAVPDMHPNALISAERRPPGAEPVPPRIVQSYKPTWTHEEALTYLKCTPQVLSRGSDADTDGRMRWCR